MTEKLFNLDVDITIENGDWSEDLLPRAEAAIYHALKVSKRPQTGPAMVSVLLTNDSAQQALNKQWRDIDKPTNVLSFSAMEPFGPVIGLVGDLSLAYETTHREALAEKTSLADHFVHLVVHGFLHCLGYDHDNKVDALEMEALETDILAGLGIDDPYADTELETIATTAETSTV